MSEDYSMVFDDTSSVSGDEDISDDNSDSAYLPNVLSPIQVRPEEEEETEGSEEGVADPVELTTPAKEACASVNNKGANDDHNDAGIVEAVDTLLKMHPLPSTSKKKKEKETSKRQGQDEKTGDDDIIVDEWRNATDTRSGRTYYYNRRTRETRWKLPTNAIFVPRKEKAKESNKKSSEILVSESLSAKDIGTTARKQHLQLQAQHEARRGRPIEDRTIENVCTQELPNQNDSTSPPGAGRQAICSPPEARRIDGPSSTTRLKDDVLFGPATTTSSSASRSPLSSNAIVASTPAPGMASTSSSAPTPTYCQPHSHYHLTGNQRQNADDHPIFCVYCASTCSSIDGLADHLLECQAYMSMLAKHPRAQHRLEDMMLRTWGIRREIPIATAEDSFDARLISHSHIGVVDSVATPSIAEHLTPPNPATRNDTTGSTSRSSSSIHYWDRTPPSAMTARPITASTISSANTDTRNAYYVGSSEKYDDTCTAASSSPLRECAFCGRAVENLSKHLLRCKTRQRTQERRRKASAMAMASGSGHMPGSTAAVATTTTTIQRVMSGGRSLPGHPRTTDKRIDHARRLDYY